MTDLLISRKAAIAAICEDNEWLEEQRCTDITLAERRWRDVDILSALPTVDPERKTGHWNSYYHTPGNFTYSCSYCGYSAAYHLIGNSYIQKRWNFCSNCGSKMENTDD